MDHFPAVAELLPFRADLFLLCGRSVAGSRLLAGGRADNLASVALSAVLQGGIGSGAATPEEMRTPRRTSGCPPLIAEQGCIRSAVRRTLWRRRTEQGSDGFFKFMD